MTISDSAMIPLNPDPKELSRLLKGLDVKWANIKVENLATAWDGRVAKLAKSLHANRRE